MKGISTPVQERTCSRSHERVGVVDDVGRVVEEYPEPCVGVLEFIETGSGI